MLKDAKDQCDYLVVGLQNNPSIDRLHKNRPIQSLKERKIQLEAVKYINEIIVYETETELYQLLQKIKPNVRILGTDYINKSFTGDDLDIAIYYHERNHNYSTTNLKERISTNKIK